MGGRIPVVAAAIVRDGRLLACRRTAPAATAGRWELPGGKVEADESPEAALAREIAEELGLAITVEQWLDGSSPMGETHVLTVAVAEAAAGEPQPTEHDEVRWLTAHELDDVYWLEPDRPFLPQLREIPTP